MLLSCLQTRPEHDGLRVRSSGVVGEIEALDRHGLGSALVDKLGDLLYGRCLHALQGVLVTQLLPLLQPELVVGQQLDELQRWLLSCPTDQCVHVLWCIRVPRDQDIAQLERNLSFLQFLRKVERHFEFQACQSVVLHWVHVLDAEHDNIGVGQYNVPVALLGALAVGVDARREPHLVHLLKEGRHKVGLQHGLATGARHASPVGTKKVLHIADLFRQLSALHELPILRLEIPSVRVGAELAAHRTALKEHKVSYSWTVDSGERLDRMNGAHNVWDGVRLVSPPPVARVLRLLVQLVVGTIQVAGVLDLGNHVGYLVRLHSVRYVTPFLRLVHLSELFELFR
mmetsp:Transcript_39508/g.70816  ORF Transcript_39508/g.70816 Transcript_39508/m.70816 type:complete len:342 (+) Transcript_39508:374-1399(+)